MTYASAFFNATFLTVSDLEKHILVMSKFISQCNFHPA